MLAEPQPPSPLRTLELQGPPKKGLYRGHIGVSRDNGKENGSYYLGVLGPKYRNIKSIWALKPHYLCPWTLRITNALGNVLMTG